MKLLELLDLHKHENILSTSTIGKYNSVIRTFVRDTGIDNISVNREQVIDWRNKVYKRVKPITCNTYIRHMKALFNTAIKRGVLDHNVFTTIKMLKVGKPIYKLISNETINILLAVLKRDIYFANEYWFYEAMIDCLRYTAIRRRQLIGIKWRDINFIDKTLFLDEKFSKNKTANLIPINQKLIDHFIIIKDKSYNPQGHHQVFNITRFVRAYKGPKMKEDHISALFARWSKKINVQISSHRFRHTVATKIANSGTNLKTVGQLLGHAHLKTTLNYVHINIDDMREVMNLL